MSSIRNALKKLDMNPETDDTFKVRTMLGATISIITVIIMGGLFLTEVSTFINYKEVEDMVIDKETTDQTRINLSIDFPFIPCDLIQIGYKDALGNDRTDLENEIYKTSLDVNGNTIGVGDKSKISLTAETKEEALKNNPHTDDHDEVVVDTEAPEKCLSCYGAESETVQCCNTCDALLRAYRKKNWSTTKILTTSEQCKGYSYLNKLETGVEKGCRVSGVISISKVQGHMFIVPGRINDIVSIQEARVFERVNVTHTINYFSLGESLKNHTSPFNSKVGIMATDSPSMYQYFINAIPTTYIDKKRREIKTYQVTETHHIRPLGANSALMPGVYFVYEFSPLRAIIKETHTPFFEICTSLCSILGGVFTMMGILDSIIYSISRKAESRSRSAESEVTAKFLSKRD